MDITNEIKLPDTVDDEFLSCTVRCCAVRMLIIFKWAYFSNKRYFKCVTSFRDLCIREFFVARSRIKLLICNSISTDKQNKLNMNLVKEVKRRSRQFSVAVVLNRNKKLANKLLEVEKTKTEISRNTMTEFDAGLSAAGRLQGAVVAWRIEKLVPVYQENFAGSFYSGDAYIVLHQIECEKKYDLFFWLGAECSSDEKGACAYKTVELDTLLKDVPVQYRETEGAESKQFL